jgi:rSAM/selenodomain-associated transferase 1
MNKCALIIFIKTPIPGLVKTRLQPQLTEEQSAEIYSAFLRDLNDTFKKANNFDLWYAVSPENFNEDILARFIQLDKYFLQEDRDLGERMQNAFQTLFSKGYESLVLIGSDIPSININIISQALQGLANNDCMIGPSKDGGYYLIALSSPQSYLFNDIRWSTSEVFEKTIELLDKKGLTYKILPELEDIDTYKELISFYEELKDTDKSDPEFPIHSWQIVNKIFAH